MGYDNKPENTSENYYYAQTFPEESSLQRRGNIPFYHGPVLQRGYGLGSIFKSVARSVRPSLKEIGKSALTTGLEVLQDVAKARISKQRQGMTEGKTILFPGWQTRKMQSTHQNLRNVNISLESFTTLYFQS